MAQMSLSSPRFVSKLAKSMGAVTIATVAVLVSGCASQRPDTSEVVVAPLGIPGGQTQGVYSGGPVVDNTPMVSQAANTLPSLVFFAFDSSDITPEAAAILDQHIAFMQSNPDAAVLVAGHTDEIGSREYNLALGERRAEAVRSYLQAHGVNDANIGVISYGEERPLVQSNSQAAYARNRRAELSYPAQ